MFGCGAASPFPQGDRDVDPNFLLNSSVQGGIRYVFHANVASALERRTHHWRKANPKTAAHLGTEDAFANGKAGSRPCMFNVAIDSKFR